MSNALVYDDEISLLEAIRGSVAHYILNYYISERFYRYTSYILKKVCAVRYDGEAVPIESDEQSDEEFDFLSSDLMAIGDILKEIESRGSMEMDDHIFALHLLKILQASRFGYSMDFILFGSLAAFAVTHGVWLLVLKFVCANSSNRKEDISMILKTVEGLFVSLRRKQGKEDTNCFHEYFYIYISLISSSITRMPDDNWESMYSLDSLIKTMLEVTSVAHLFLKNVFGYITNSLKGEFDSLMLLSIYWVARGVLACSSACLQLPKYGYIIQNPHELEGIHKKLVSVLERLHKLDDIGKLYLEDEKIANAYQIPNKKGRDNYFALMALFRLQPNGSEEFKLLRCSENNMKQDASLVSLRRKVLVLIISGLNISSNEINLLSEIYTESITQLKQTECEFIWLPMYSGLWTTSLEEKYVKLKQMMLWYTVHHPTFLTVKTRKFIRRIWKFHRRTVAVVLNEDGNVVCPNAIHFMYVWRAKAFPYSRMIMRTLWKDEKRLDSLVLGFDPHISTLLEASKLVILFGGTDMDWIQKFIGCIQGVSVDSATSIQLIFIPKNGDSEIQETMSSTATEMSNNYPHVLKNMWYFWTRLESLLISKYQATSASVPFDSTEPIIRRVQELLGYSSAGSWACLITLSSGAPMIHGNGDLMLKAFMEYDLWKQHVQTKNFTMALYMYVEQLRELSIQDYPCSRVVLNIDDKDVVKSLTCSHCIRPMEKKIQYRCCHIDE